MCQIFQLADYQSEPDIIRSTSVRIVMQRLRSLGWQPSSLGWIKGARKTRIALNADGMWEADITF